MMNHKPTNGYKEDPQEQLPPIDGTVSNRPKINKISTDKLNHTSSKDCQERWPNWVMACASILLVLVTGFYTHYAKQQIHLTREGLDATRDTLTENTRQFSATLQEIKEQTVAAQTAAAAAKESARAAIKVANATESQIAIARQQMEINKQQIDESREALRLDQRAWLGYKNCTIQARATGISAWEEREPNRGEEFRGRFNIENVGKTPALNVRLISGVPRVLPIGETPKGPIQWSDPNSGNIIFPNNEVLNQNTGSFTIPDHLFSAYSGYKSEIFLWARLYYCDTAGRRHWTQIGVAHLFGSKDFTMRSSSVSPDPGEADHPYCHN